jgi:hypothetical protein
MKSMFPVLMLLMLGNYPLAAQSSWKSPDFRPETYRNIMVHVKIADELVRRQTEDAVVKMLRENDVSAVNAYSNILEEHVSSEEAFLSRADHLEIDAMLVYEIVGEDHAIKNTPSVGASVGVPVKIGIFHGYVGSHMPIAGGSKTETILKMNVSLYIRSSHASQWIFPMTCKYKTKTDVIAPYIAKTTQKALIRDGIIL